MNKFLYFIVFVLSFFSVHAQSQDSREEIQTLVQRVDSLEHELSYLKLDYQLYTLNSEIVMFKNEVNTQSVEIQLNVHKRNFDSRLYHSYKENYESLQAYKQSISRKINATKLLFTIKTVTYPYSESELNVLKARCDTIDAAYKTLEKAMNLLKLCIDIYKESL